MAIYWMLFLIALTLNTIQQMGYVYLKENKNNQPVQIFVEPDEK